MTDSESRLPDAADEYVALRSEMTSLHVSIRTVWVSLFAIFFAAAGALLAFLGTLHRTNSLETSSLLRFVHVGGLNWATAILLAVLLSGMYLVYLWLRHAYYLGSYIQVFHEKDNPGLKWLTRNRSITDPTLKRASKNVSTGFRWTSGILLFISILPAISGFLILSSSENVQGCAFSFNSFNLGLIFSFIFLGGCIIQLYRLFKSRDERQTITSAWDSQRAKEESEKNRPPNKALAADS